MNTKLTAPMIKALGQARVANVSSNNFRIGTLTALEARGLVVLADRFASGACLFRITAKGIRTLVEVAERNAPIGSTASYGMTSRYFLTGEEARNYADTVTEGFFEVEYNRYSHLHKVTTKR